MNYRTEFPDFDLILDTDRLAAHGLADCSWHNDAVPSFDKTIGDYRIVLWVNDTRANDQTNAPFIIEVSLDGEAVADRYADTLDEALALVDRFTRRVESGIVYVLQHWFDGDWDDMTTFPVYLDEDEADEALEEWLDTVAHEAHYRGEHGDTNPNNYRVLERVTA